MNRYRLQRYEDFTNWQNLRIFVKWPTDYYWIGKNYDLVVMPESTSRVNQYMLRYIYRFAQPTLRKMADVLNYKSNEDICTKVRKHNVLVIDDESTSISTVTRELQNGEFYNLQGQRISSPKQGLYIVNGKKVVIK